MFSSIATGVVSGASGFGTLSGYTITETAGFPAQVSLREAASGTIVALINLVAFETVREQFGDNPITFTGDGFKFYFSVDVGTVRWTAYGK